MRLVLTLLIFTTIGIARELVAPHSTVRILFVGIYALAHNLLRMPLKIN